MTNKEQLTDQHLHHTTEPAPAADRPLWKVIHDLYWYESGAAGAYYTNELNTLVDCLSRRNTPAIVIDAVADWLMADHPAHATAASRLHAEARRAREGA